MASIQGVYVALFGRPADPTGLAYFNGVTKNGADLSAINNLAGEKEYTDRFAGQSNIQIVNSIYISLFNRAAEPTGLNFFVDALNKGTLNINNIAIAILDGAQGNDKTVAANKIAAADLFTAALDTPAEIGSYTGANAAASARAWLATVTTTAATQAQVDAQVKAIEVIGTGGVQLSVTDANAVSTNAATAALRSTDGDDTITVTDAYTAASVINGGFGTDTLVVKNVASTITAATLKTNLLNVEKVVATASAASSFDFADNAGVSSVTSSASTDAITFTNLSAGASLNVSGAATTVTFGFKEAATSATTINLDKATITTGLVLNNGNAAVNLVNTGPSSVTGFNAADAQTVTISGSGNITGFGLAVATDKITKVDASALTGTLKISLVNADNGIKITGTNNADDITLSAAGKADVVVYNSAEKSNYGLSETITTFIAVEDKIDLKAFGFTKTGAVNLTNITDGAAVFGTSSVGWINDGTNTWVFADSNNNGTLDLGTDFAVKLAGAVSLTDANFILAA